ncbi:MAG TPA: phage holin family protein [Bryobacteraceae bacterium]|nr:phage holin family protein [Bryobacteraceae bacterium]
MVYFIVNWVSSAVGLLLVAALLPGFRITDFQSAVIACGVVGLLSAGLGSLLKHAASYLTVALFGGLLLIVDAFLFRLSALLVPGFAMLGFLPALAGAALLLALNLALLRIPLKEDPLDSGSWLSS